MYLRFTIILFVFALLSISENACSATCGDFTDNYEGEYCDDVVLLTEKGLINGYHDNTFRYERELSRREMIKLAVLAKEKKEKVKSYKSSILLHDFSKYECFTDVVMTKQKDLSKYICYAKEKLKIIEGYKDGSYRPDNKVSYGEASKMILLALSGGKKCWKSYDDSLVNYVKYMNKIISKDVDSSSRVKRDFFAHMLRHAIEVKDEIEKCNPVKDNDFEDYIGIMKTTLPYNDIGKPVDEIRCNEQNMNIRVKDRKICTRRFEKGELAIVYNDDGKIDFAVPYVPLFNEYFGSGNTCSIMPYDTNKYYISESLFQKDACNGMTLCGNRAKGCHILSVGMIDYYYHNKRINGSEVNDYNKWLRDNGQSDGCGLVLPANKKYMNLSSQGNQSILKTFKVRNSDYISQMQKTLNGNSKLQSYVKTRRPVLLQYKYKGPVDNNTHAIVLVGKDVSGNYIVQDPYFNRLSNGRTTMFLTLQEAIENHKRERDTTDITFTKLIFYYGK